MIADPIRLIRLAVVLGDAAKEIAAHEPEDAADLLWAVGHFQGMLLAGVPPEKAPRLSKREQRARARSWYLERQRFYVGRTPPSLNADYRDAAEQIPGVSQRMLRSERPIEWQVTAALT